MVEDTPDLAGGVTGAGALTDHELEAIEADVVDIRAGRIIPEREWVASTLERLLVTIELSGDDVDDDNWTADVDLEKENEELRGAIHEAIDDLDEHGDDVSDIAAALRKAL